ncbi:ABC-three component system middle component 4 [Aliarcobacter butzleri]|uniref:ABC-three component system middle component 4 n=1 Tax=Aliarcobacter butzleri TaxID=28197 RepID=UPI003AF4E83F
MLKNLPFITPENDFELNLLLTFQVVYFLNSTTRGLNILDIERLNIYIYFIKNPHILYRVLIRLGKNSFTLKSYENSSYKSERNDTETLYDNEKVRYYIQLLVSNNLINITYNDKIGFVFYPSEGTEKYINVDSKYFKRNIILIEKIKQINSTSVSKINTAIKSILEER